MKKKAPKSIPEACLCCGHPLQEKDKFCPYCGQKSNIERLRVKDFLKEFISNFYSLDSKVLKTVQSLFTKPGKSSLDFIEGKRVLYANPFQFYLSVSVVYFLITGLMGKLDAISVNNLEEVIKSEQKSISVTEPAQRDSLESLRYFKAEEIKDSSFISQTSLKIETFVSLLKKHEKKPLSIQKSLDSLGYNTGKWNLFLLSIAKIIQDLGDNPLNRNLFLDYIKGNLPLILFITLPFLGLVFWLIYVRKKYTYAEHLVFVFNLNAYLFIWLLVLALFKWFSGVDLNFLIYLILPVYLFLALRRFYKQGFGRTLFKLFLLSIGIGIQSFMGATLVFLIAFLLY